MILLGVASDVVANFATTLNNEKHTHGCVIILKHQHIKNLVSHKHIHILKWQWHAHMRPYHRQTLPDAASKI